MLLNIKDWSKQKISFDELTTRLVDFQEQEAGLLKMINSGMDFIGASRTDLRKMVLEVRDEIVKIENALRSTKSPE